MTRENVRSALPGLLMLPLLIAGIGVAIWLFTRADARHSHVLGIAGALVLLGSVLGLLGLFAITPNQACVLTLFGKYTGTVREDGFYWVNPFSIKRKVSLRVRNFETEKLKVNDLDGNPVEIGAVVVWRVVDTAEAIFEVDDYENFVHVQSEAALRNLATHYHYDTGESDEISLRGNTDLVADKLAGETQARLQTAGVKVIEARIAHLAYAPEIAEAMLRRQQAGAIIAARKKIVEGAVGMVEDALAHLSERSIVELDDERRAAMVSNLLVVLCSEHATQPVVNTGTLYT